MAPLDVRRPYKRAAVSDQQRRRELALERQVQQRADSHARARSLASSLLAEPDFEPELEPEEAGPVRVSTVLEASKLKGCEARRWFSRQLMLPEWMVDVPPHLDRDWYVLPRPAGKRCFVVSSDGTTVSRLRNGSVLHHFPSSLPNGARKRVISGPADGYCILDCIFHEIDQTYYVIDMVCWRGYSLYDCAAEFRFFWLNSKLTESGACDPPSTYHRYRFSVVPIYDCNQMGLHAAYAGAVPFAKDGLLFYNKHAHYQSGNTPLVLVWKDEKCSQYLLDTDSKGEVPDRQQVVLELQDNGKLSTSDDPPVVFGRLDGDFVQKMGQELDPFTQRKPDWIWSKCSFFYALDCHVAITCSNDFSESGFRVGNLLRFAIKDEGVRLRDGKMEINDMEYTGKANRARAFADSYSKVLFQYTVRHCPLGIDDLMASIHPFPREDNISADIEMAG